MKELVEELKKQIKQMKGVDSLGSVMFSDLSIHQGVRFPSKYKFPDFDQWIKDASTLASRCVVLP